MAHHKRRRSKNARSGCLLCKPHKANGVAKTAGAQTLQELRARATESEWRASLTADALDQSVTHLLGEEVAPDRNELYAGWRRAFDAGEASVFREPVIDLVRRFQRLLGRPKGKAR